MNKALAGGGRGAARLRDDAAEGGLDVEGEVLHPRGVVLLHHVGVHLLVGMEQRRCAQLQKCRNVNCFLKKLKEMFADKSEELRLTSNGIFIYETIYQSII